MYNYHYNIRADREYLKRPDHNNYNNRGRKETTMANNRLWRQVVDDYYKEQNYYLVGEA